MSQDIAIAKLRLESALRSLLAQDAVFNLDGTWVDTPWGRTTNVPAVEILFDVAEAKSAAVKVLPLEAATRFSQAMDLYETYNREIRLVYEAGPLENNWNYVDGELWPSGEHPDLARYRRYLSVVALLAQANNILPRLPLQYAP